MLQLIVLCQVLQLAKAHRVKIQKVKEGRYIVEGKITIFVRVSYNQGNWGWGHLFLLLMFCFIPPSLFGVDYNEGAVCTC